MADVQAHLARWQALDLLFLEDPAWPPEALLEAPPFPGASNWFLLADLDDPEFLADLIRATADALPVPRIKMKKSRAAKSPGGKRIPKGAARRV